MDMTIQTTADLGKKIDTTIQTTSDLLKKIDTTVQTLGKKIDTSLRTTAHLSLKAFNAYYDMSQTSEGKNNSKQKEIRNKFYEVCGISDSPAEKGTGVQQAVCALTGRAGKLKLAHLVPASAGAPIRNVLKLSDDADGIWSFRNVLLLSMNIESEFDRMKLSFSAVPTQENTFIM